ncbi:hypothetical protein Q5424_24415 [Conexibacter sp. JD483]|uniref:hypothetical protein n=1 Tax=unclassified Conexibacter TaxID=2627773 RepID=UPI00271A9777|nr:MULTISPECIES: hypothetical protein [unclassified Conexibacter]MDO8189206.1 hypothetical protein [Conexibacter sp. CPCC 205706]MDO8201346.1 hypothetical protein [Conexibacter sp. CPCC 205762]MDR9372265.1 hypothetical protein [Conexibacter sp. JD483]
MPVGRVTIVDARPGAVADAERWLAGAGHAEADAGVVELGRVVRAHRVASGDPGVPLPRLTQALAVRVGYGAGEEVADGRWRAARELPPVSDDGGARRRGRMLHPQERLAALLGGRSHALACEELTLRARHDLDHGQLREAALQLRIALDAALAELPATPQATALEGRVTELDGLRGSLAALADDALGGVLPADAASALDATLRRLEAALRARTAAESGHTSTSA